MRETKLKEIFYKLAFLYPRIYAFFCYYRKKERRREIGNKFEFFLKRNWSLEEKKRVIRHIFELRGSRKMMRYLIPLMDGPFIERYVKTENLHYLDQVSKEGRGVVLMAGHLGNPHLSFNALRIMGYPVTVIKGGSPRRPKYPRIQYYDQSQNTIFTHDPSFQKGFKQRMVETLKSGGIIYQPGDATAGRIKESTLFFGIEMGFPTAVVHLAHQANAAILPFIHFYQRGEITLIFKEPIDEHWKRGEEEYGRVVKEFANILESYITTYPEQYMGIYGPTLLAHSYRSHQNKNEMQGEEREKK